MHLSAVTLFSCHGLHVTQHSEYMSDGYGYAGGRRSIVEITSDCVLRAASFETRHLAVEWEAHPMGCLDVHVRQRAFADKTEAVA